MQPKLETKNCKSCGKFFLKKQTKHVFCQDRCRARYGWLKRRKLERPPSTLGLKKCEKCRREFKQKIWNQRYCCIRCRDTHYYDITFRALVEPRYCRVCNKQYQPKNNQHHYCSEKCRKQHVADRNMAIYRSCESCHARFQSPKEHARFCSDGCLKDWKKLHYNDHRKSEKPDTAGWHHALSQCAEELGIVNPIGPAYVHKEIETFSGESEHGDAIKAFLERGGKIDKYTMVESKSHLNEVGWADRKRGGGLRQE